MHVRSWRRDITKVGTPSEPRRRRRRSRRPAARSQEKIYDNPLDKRRIRVDRNKNKLSANYCAVRFAEISQERGRLASGRGGRPRCRSTGALRARTPRGDATIAGEVGGGLLIAGCLQQWTACGRGGRGEAAAVVAGAPHGTRRSYKGRSGTARAQCAPVSRAANLRLRNCVHSSPRARRRRRHADPARHLPPAVRSLPRTRHRYD